MFGRIADRFLILSGKCNLRYASSSNYTHCPNLTALKPTELPAIHPAYCKPHSSHHPHHLLIPPPTAIPTVPNGGNHTPGFTAAAKTPEAHAATMLTTKALALAGFRVLDDAEYYAKVRCAVCDRCVSATELTRRNLSRQRRRSIRGSCSRGEGWAGAIEPRTRAVCLHAMVFNQIGYLQIAHEC